MRSATWGQNELFVSAGNGWPHNALRHHWLMPISCHFRDCKALLVTSLTHVSGAIASAQTFTFTFRTRPAQPGVFVRYTRSYFGNSPEDDFHPIWPRHVNPCPINYFARAVQKFPFVDHLPQQPQIEGVKRAPYSDQPTAQWTH